MPSWDSAAADALWTDACGKDRWLGTVDSLDEAIRSVSSARLWQLRTAATAALVEFARERLARQLAACGAAPEAVEEARHLFDPNALTLGFARRFATYKRPNLLLHDPERLLRLLNDPERPVQIIIAGKAHPADQAGQALIQEWIRFIRRTEARPRVIFLSDYDMLLTEHLVQGVDVWINTPRRPWEACGTSGMKVLVNGGLNLSELDGWWAEAYRPGRGLGTGGRPGPRRRSRVGRGRSRGALRPARTGGGAGVLHPRRDGHPGRLGRADAGEHGAADATLLRRPRGARVHRAALPSGCRRLPRARGRRLRGGPADCRLAARGGGAMGRAPVRRREDRDERDATTRSRFSCSLHDLDPEAVRVELYADGVNGDGPVRQEMTRVRRLEGADGGCVYRAEVPATRPAADYTVRVVPHHDGVAVPLEVAQILWRA